MTNQDIKEKEESAEPSLWRGSGDEDIPGGSSRKTFAKKKSKLKRVLTGTGIGIVLVVAIITPFSFPNIEFSLTDFALNRPNRISSFIKETRIQHGFTRMQRASSTGDIGETRVGFIGSRMFANINDRLANDHGISFERRDSSGRPTRLLVDPPPESSMRAVTPEETGNRVAQRLGIPEGRVSVSPGPGRSGTAGVVNVDMQGLSITQLRNIGQNVASLDNDISNQTSGRMIVSQRYRTFGKFWNAPSLFHPFQRIGSALQESYDVRAQRIQERNRKTRNGRVAQLANRYTAARDNLRNRVSGGALAGAGAALSFTGGLCLLSEISEIMPLLNYSLIVQPAMEEAIDKKAVASQQRSGEDFSDLQIAAVVESFTDDEGRYFMGAQSMNALVNGGPGEGEPTDPALRQAFMMRGSSLEVLSATLFEGVPQLEELATGSDAFAKAACSPAGYGLQIVAGGALSILAPGGAILKTTQAAGSLAIYSLITNIAANFLEDTVAERAANICGVVDEGEEEGLRVEDAHKFGACMAYGARGAHNTTMSSAGGIELSQEQESRVVQALNEHEAELFNEKSFFARIFDGSETRSLMSRAAMFLYSNNLLNLSTITSNIGNIPSFFSSSIKNLMSSNASAEEGEYDFGFPLITMPLSIMEDPRFEDPYRNAEAVNQLERTGALEDRYADRAMDCFGVAFRRVNGLLVTVPVNEVVHLEDEYVDADCSNLSDADWIRIMLFVFDDAIITSMQCWEGSDEACNDIRRNR